MDARGKVLVASGGAALLAIGVVLGSGPLRASLLGGMGDELAALEAAADEAHAQAAAAEREAEAGRQYLEELAPALLDGLLPGATILVIDLGGEAAEPVAAGVAVAGATVGGTVTLGPEWTDPDQAPFRAALAEQVAATVDGLDGATPEEVLAHAFVQGATGGAARSDVGAGGIDTGGTDRGAVLWDLLSQAGLASGTPATEVDGIVLAIGEGEGAALADAAAGYQLPLVVVGAPDAVAPFESRPDVPTVGADDWTHGAVTATATLAEAFAGTVAHHRIGPGEDQVPDLLGTSAVPTATAG